MAQAVLLNNVSHQDLRIVTERSAALGDGVMSALAFPNEFRQLQAHYPIVFQKAADGVGFQPVAVLGLKQGQNLFLGERGWDAPVLPMSLEREPFLIGRDGEELLVHVDMQSPRIARDSEAGEPVFLPHGGSTPYLERITSLLLAIHEGVQQVSELMAALLEHELLESFVLDAELVDGSQIRLAGLYTLNEERLNQLSGAALEQLHRAGHLQAIYMVLASQSNFRDLIERQDRLLATAD